MCNEMYGHRLAGVQYTSTVLGRSAVHCFEYLYSSTFRCSMVSVNAASCASVCVWGGGRVDGERWLRCGSEQYAHQGGTCLVIADLLA